MDLSRRINIKFDNDKCIISPFNVVNNEEVKDKPNDDNEIKALNLYSIISKCSPDANNNNENQNNNNQNLNLNSIDSDSISLSLSKSDKEIETEFINTNTKESNQFNNKNINLFNNYIDNNNIEKSIKNANKNNIINISKNNDLEISYKSIFYSDKKSFGLQTEKSKINSSNNLNNINNFSTIKKDNSKTDGKKIEGKVLFPNNNINTNTNANTTDNKCNKKNNSITTREKNKIRKINNPPYSKILSSFEIIDEIINNKKVKLQGSKSSKLMVNNLIENDRLKNITGSNIESDSNNKVKGNGKNMIKIKSTILITNPIMNSNKSIFDKIINNKKSNIKNKNNNNNSNNNKINNNNNIIIANNINTNNRNNKKTTNINKNQNKNLIKSKSQRHHNPIPKKDIFNFNTELLKRINQTKENNPISHNSNNPHTIHLNPSFHPTKHSKRNITNNQNLKKNSTITNTLSTRENDKLSINNESSNSLFIVINNSNKNTSISNNKLINHYKNHSQKPLNNNKSCKFNLNTLLTAQNINHNFSLNTNSNKSAPKKSSNIKKLYNKINLYKQNILNNIRNQPIKIDQYNKRLNNSPKYLISNYSNSNFSNKISPFRTITNNNKNDNSYVDNKPIKYNNSFRNNNGIKYNSINNKDRLLLINNETNKDKIIFIGRKNEDKNNNGSHSNTNLNSFRNINNINNLKGNCKNKLSNHVKNTKTNPN